MGRTIRTTLPRADVGRPVSKGEMEAVRFKETQIREDNRKRFDKRHGTREQPELQEGNSVWISDLKRRGEITRKASEPRSYIIQTSTGPIRRNRKFLSLINPRSSTDGEQGQMSGRHHEKWVADTLHTGVSPEDLDQSWGVEMEDLQEPYTTRTGRAVRAPRRMDL